VWSLVFLISAIYFAPGRYKNKNCISVEVIGNQSPYSDYFPDSIQSVAI